MAKLKISAKSGNAAGFSNIPGSTNYALSFGKQFVGGFKKGQKLGGPKPGGPKPGKPKDTKPEGETITDTAPDTDGEPTKPKKVKSRSATTADVEKAVAGGFITPEEATGGEWGKNMGLSSTYSRKYAANAAEHGGKAKGKKFTGPNPERDTSPIWDTPESKGNSNRGKQFPSL